MVRLLITRPMPEATQTAARVEALGASATIAPLTEMALLLAALPDPRTIGAIAVTSARAVLALEERAAHLPYLDLPLFAVGDVSADAARAAGFSNVKSAGGAVNDLVAMIKTAAPEGDIYYPSARHLGADLGASLAKARIVTRPSAVYQMAAAKVFPENAVTALTDGKLDGVLHYSRRAAQLFVDLVAGAELDDKAQDLTHFCLSANVAAPLVAARYARLALADHPSEEAILALTLSFVRERTTP